MSDLVGPAGGADALERLLEISAEHAEGVDAVWSFRIGDRRSDVHVKDGSALPVAGGTEAEVTVSCSAETWEALLAGELSPQIAWALDRLRVSGDMRLAQRTRAIFAF
jgi:putative sterol carrier protein